MATMNTKKIALYISPDATLPSGSDGFLETSEAVVASPEVDTIEFKRVASKIGNTDSYTDVNKNMFSLGISHNVRQSNQAQDALGTVPEWGVLARIAGFDEVIDTATPTKETVTYTNSQTPTRGSIQYYMDGKKFTMTDTAVADFTITALAGQMATISGNIQGYVDNAGVPTDEVAPATTSTTNAPLGLTTIDAITVGGDALLCDSFTFSTNPEITNIYGTGTKQHDIDDYAMTLEFTYYVDPTKYSVEIADLNNPQVKTIDIKLGTTGGALVSGKSIHITAEVAKIKNFTDSVDQNKLKRTVTYNLQLDEANADKAISLKTGYFA